MQGNYELNGRMFLLLSADVGADAMLLSADSVCIDILLCCQYVNTPCSLYALTTQQTLQAYKNSFGSVTETATTTSVVFKHRTAASPQCFRSVLCIVFAKSYHCNLILHYTCCHEIFQNRDVKFVFSKFELRF